jgi:NAD dependent epimerase/dehydratase family enzyme
MGCQNKVKKPEAFISASELVYTVQSVVAICTEDQKPANDFSLTCQKWEAVANQFQRDGIRTVKVRTGLVLGKTMVF